MRNIELHKYRTGSVLHGSTAPTSRLLAQLLAVTLWRSLGTLCAPLGKILALYLWAGRSLLGLATYLEHLLLHLVGWLSGTAFGKRHRLTRLSLFYFGAYIRRWHVGIAALVAGGALAALYRRVRASFDPKAQRRAQYQALMASAPTYEQWKALAAQLRQLEASDSQQPQTQQASKASGQGGSGQISGKAAGAGGSSHAAPLPYDRKLLHEKTKHLRQVRLSANVREMMFALRLDLVRNIANIAKCNLQDNIPDPIQRYLAEVKEILMQIRDWPEHDLPVSEKLAFFRETRHAFGRTALLLSGGGSFGTYHMGVCKALFEQRILPRVMAGSSAGAIVSAIVATRTDVELKEHFDTINLFNFDFYSSNHVGAMANQILRKGSLQDMAHLIKRLRLLLGDLTFLEAYERTGRILNVSVCPADTNEPPRLLNYLTAPNALVWSAVAASSAFPGLFPPQHLLARNSSGEIVTFSADTGDSGLERRWRDGSLELDLPAQALGEMFNCNHYIVGQTNPHIVPLLNLKHMVARRISSKWANILEAELKHRCQVLQWMLPDWMDSASRILTLFTQPWEGDITMTLPLDISMQISPIINPQRVDLVRLLKVGEGAAWQKLSAIECNCTIEATLDSCMAAVSNRVRGRPMAHMHTRIPSWLHMPGLGLPVVASWGDNAFTAAAVQAAEMERAASWGEHQGGAMVDGLPVRMLPPTTSGGLLAGIAGIAGTGSKVTIEEQGDEDSLSCASSLTLGQPSARPSLDQPHLQHPQHLQHLPHRNNNISRPLDSSPSSPTSSTSVSSASHTSDASPTSTEEGATPSTLDGHTIDGMGATPSYASHPSRRQRNHAAAQGSGAERAEAGEGAAGGGVVERSREGAEDSCGSGSGSQASSVCVPGVGVGGGSGQKGLRRDTQQQQNSLKDTGAAGAGARLSRQRTGHRGSDGFTAAGSNGAQPNGSGSAKRQQRRRGGSGVNVGRRASEPGQVSEQEMIALAQMDCTDASAGVDPTGSFWTSLLPLTTGAASGQGLLQPPKDSDHGIDLFAY